MSDEMLDFKLNTKLILVFLSLIHVIILLINHALHDTGMEKTNVDVLMVVLSLKRSCLVFKISINKLRLKAIIKLR